MPRLESNRPLATVHDLVETAAQIRQAKNSEKEQRLITAAKRLVAFRPAFRDLAAYMLASQLPYDEIGHLFEDVELDPESAQGAYDDITDRVVDFHRRTMNPDDTIG